MTLRMKREGDCEVHFEEKAEPGVVGEDVMGKDDSRGSPFGRWKSNGSVGITGVIWEGTPF